MGKGEAENERDATGGLGESDLRFVLGLVEVRRQIREFDNGTAFGLRADIAWARLRTGQGLESVDGLEAAVNQQRIGAEVSRPLTLGGLSLQPFGEAHLRRDGGAGRTGAGLELALGLRAHRGIVRLDVQGRGLVIHGSEGYRERGAGLTLAVGDPGGDGLSLSLSPSFGGAATTTGALWEEQIYRRHAPDPARSAWTMDARGDYGMQLPGGGRLTWFTTVSQSSWDRAFIVGASIAPHPDRLFPFPSER